ncbi:MAG: EscU/YscU/HrcU family type III secretion system export apparatus switch protein [Acidobacteriota bacterium]|jgi:flagellar biosynthetic protein FlhB|nr:MAG: flagellar biosynthetic protein FlhB [Acidobacteriota bacterium]
MAQQSTGERTEKPTAKRIRDARQRGQVARSRDLSAAVSLAAVTLGLAWLGIEIVTGAAERVAVTLGTLADRAHTAIVPGTVEGLLWSNGSALLRLAGPPALIAGLLSVGASMLQIGWNFSPKALELNWSRLSPTTGFSRLKPIQALPELGKALAGIAVVGAIVAGVVYGFYQQAPLLMNMSAVESGRFTWERLWTLLWRSSLALVVLAAVDYAVQYWRWYTGLKMTRQEVIDESKMNEGRPEVKARIRRIQRDMARSRMLKAVETATVVVTNPTHYAVALEYRRGEMAAPRVVAKGVDHMAARIREIARRHDVPIVENVALARALHKHTEVGDTIPADLFGAVAEVLAYLVRMKRLVL